MKNIKNKRRIVKFYILISFIMSIIQIGCSQNITKENQLKENQLKETNTDKTFDIYMHNIDTVWYEDVLNLKNKFEISGKLSDEKLWSPFKISDTGLIYGYSETYDEGKTDLISYDLNSNNFKIISTRDNYFEPIFLEFTENYIFWLESNSDYENPHTRFVLYNILSKETTIIAENNYFYYLDGSIAMNDEILLWVDYKIENNINIPIIKKYDLITGEYSTYKENALNPVICNDFIAYLGPDSIDENKVGLYIDYFNSEEIKQYAKNYNIYEIEGYNNSLILAYNDLNDQKIGILENESIRELVTNKDTDIKFEYLELSDNFIYWASLQQFLIYDRNSDKTLLIDADDESAKGGISNKYIYQIKTDIDQEYSKTTENKNISKSHIYIYEINN